MTIEEMLDALETCGRRKTPRIIWESVLYYFGSIMLNKYKLRKFVGSRRDIRYYSIIFAKSGQGKSYSVNTIQKLCKLDKYPDAMSYYYKQSIKQLPEKSSDYEEILKYMPKSITIGVEGTAEGLFYVAKSQAESNFGSLNLYTDEFGEAISSSSGLLSKLKDLYDGTYKTKVIKGTEDSTIHKDIENIVCNFVALGSRKGVSAEAEKELTRIASSGMFRRTFIIDNKDPVEKNKQETDIDKLEQWLEKINIKQRELTLKESGELLLEDRFFDYSDEYMDRIETIDDELIEAAQNDALNEYAQYNTGSLELVLDLSHIIAFLEDSSILKLKHIEKAYDFLKRTRESVENTFQSRHPYRSMYELLKIKDNMTISEMAEFDHNIPVQKNKIQDNIDLLEELCYRKDEVLIKTVGKVTRYKIEPLPKTNLNKMILSIDFEKKGKFAINFKPSYLKWSEMKKLILSQNADSFTLCHYEPTKKAEDGHRQEKSFIEGQNMIAFDIDDGMTIEEAKETLQDYTYILYTTKSHQKEKNGIVCDRFRIVMPTEKMYYVTPDQHKIMYENIEQILGIHSNDTQTRNVSRLFYTNPNAEIIYENDGLKLVDVSCCIPDTEKSEKILPNLQNISEQEEIGEMDRREAGMFKWVIMNTSVGNRNGNLFRAGMFFKELGQDFKAKLIYLNNMLIEPLSEREINQLIRSVEKK